MSLSMMAVDTQHLHLRETVDQMQHLQTSIDHLHLELTIKQVF